MGSFWVGLGSPCSAELSGRGPSHPAWHGNALCATRRGHPSEQREPGKTQATRGPGLRTTRLGRGQHELRLGPGDLANLGTGMEHLRETKMRARVGNARLRGGGAHNTVQTCWGREIGAGLDTRPSLCCEGAAWDVWVLQAPQHARVPFSGAAWRVDQGGDSAAWR